MPTAAARISPKLLKVIVRLDDPSKPIAETARKVAAEAERSGQTRPSYERIRQLVHDIRRARVRRGPSTAQVLFEVAVGVRHPEALLDQVSGVGLPPYDEAAGLPP
jgi:hypothetical protein